MLVTIKKNTQNTQAAILAQSMLVAAGYHVKVDGDFGDKTEEMVLHFQSGQHLVVDGIIGEKTWNVLFMSANSYLTVSANRYLGEQDLVHAANRLGIQLAAVKAVNEVESRGSGFRGDHPVILFERHVFWRRLEAYGVNPSSYATDNEDILNKKSGGYKGGTKEVKRLERAMEIHPKAALESASWGLFQIMGFHWKSLGYVSIESFVAKMKENEANQLEAFVRFLKKNKLDRILMLKNGKKTLVLDDFRNFARRYNGSAYEKNHYHTKLQKAYRKYLKQPSVKVQHDMVA